jgi:hypothetical protein
MKNFVFVSLLVSLLCLSYACGETEPERETQEVIPVVIDTEHFPCDASQDCGTMIYITVKNLGGPGQVQLFPERAHDGSRYNQSVEFHLDWGETREITMTFPELPLQLGGLFMRVVPCN